MAENLLTRSLHTKAKYAEQLSNIYTQNRNGLFEKMLGNIGLYTEIANLENKEQAYYDAADTSNYAAFKEKISSIVDDDVSRGISKLGGAELRKMLYELKSEYQNEFVEVQQETEVIINIYGLADANKGINSVLEELGKVGKTTRLKGGKVKMNLGIDPVSIKKLLNAISTLENKEGKKKVGRKYEESNIRLSSALYSKIKDMEDEGLLRVNGVEYKDNQAIIAEKLKTSDKFLGYPWNFNANDVKKATEEGAEPQFRAKLIESLNTIKQWILQIAGTTPELEGAIKEEWDKVVGEEYNNLTNAKFFLKGGYIELVVGALGEFQTAVFQNLLGQYFPKMRNKFSANIQGNVFGEGTSEQAKADVVFGNLGIQVKNYSSPARKIEGNIHPLELNKYYDENRLYDSGFFGILANRFWIEFGGGIGVADIAEDLNDAVAAILNFDVLDKHLDDKISFYMISGRYLVPASVILSHYADIQGENKKYVEITSSTEPKNEKDFNDELYWKPKGEDKYDREKANETNMLKLLNHDISLRASFNYGNIPNLDDYKLW